MTREVCPEVQEFIHAQVMAARRYSKAQLREYIAAGEWGKVTQMIIQDSPLLRRIDYETLVFGQCVYTTWDVEKNTSWTFRYLARLRGERL